MAVDGELFADRLPTYLSQFVGRQDEVDEVSERIAGRRFVTITGIGGAGKTRLAIEVAKRWRSMQPLGQVVWVPLSTVTDPGAIAAAAAAAAGVDGGSGARASPALVNALSQPPALLVLDNCEQIADGCRALVADLLERCAGLVVLCASQTPLGLDGGEDVYAIPPLGAGRSDQLGSSDATELFILRAGLLVPDYDLTPANASTIGALCTRLGGLPLAIELAASWIQVLSPRDLLAEVDQTLTDLDNHDRGVADRHRSLEAVLSRSWNLLPSEERVVLAGLAVFVGGFTRRAAEEVAGATLGLLSALVRRSLIQRLPDPAGGSRFWVHALVRDFAWTRAEGADDIQRRHFDYYLEQVESLGAVGVTPVEPDGRHPLHLEQPNVDAALAWAIGKGDAERALRMTVPFNAFWTSSTPPRSIRRARMLSVLALPWVPAGATSLQTRARCLGIAGYLVLDSDRAAAEAYFRESEALSAQIGDQVGVAAGLRARGDLADSIGDHQTERRHALGSLAICEAVGDWQGFTWSLFELGSAALAAGELERAAAYLVDVQSRFLALASPFGSGWAGTLLAEVHRRGRRFAEAVAAYRDVLDQQRTYRFTMLTAEVVEGLGLVAVDLHHLELASRLFGAAATWRTSQEKVLPRHLDEPHRPVVARARRGLGELAWATFYADGEGRTAEETLALADDALTVLGASVDTRLVGLSDRECEVLTLLADGLSNSAIAERLVLSPRTVHAHLRSIFGKLDVQTRTAAVHEAVRRNLVALPTPP